MRFKDYRYTCVSGSILVGRFDTDCLAVRPDEHFLFAGNLLLQRQSEV